MNERKRAYDASGRRARAAETRQNTVRHAAELFATAGYERTTYKMIAAAAGVSEEYVRKLGAKPILFRASVELLTIGRDDTLREAQRRLDDLAASTDARTLLARIATVTCEWNRRSHGIWWAWASSSDPALQQSWDDTMSKVRTAWRSRLLSWEPLGWLRSDVPIDELAVGIWLLTMAETYERLVVRGGLTEQQYTQWLERSLIDLLLPSERAQSATTRATTIPD